MKVLSFSPTLSVGLKNTSCRTIRQSLYAVLSSRISTGEPTYATSESLKKKSDTVRSASGAGFMNIGKISKDT